MRAAKLYQTHTMEQLLVIQRANDEARKLNDTPYRRQLAEAITWAITYHLADLRKARGDPINNEGYSGRNRKK